MEDTKPDYYFCTGKVSQALELIYVPDCSRTAFFVFHVRDVECIREVTREVCVGWLSPQECTREATYEECRLAFSPVVPLGETSLEEG